MLQGYFDLLDDLVAKWGLAPAEARGVFLQVADALDKAASGGDGAHADKSQRFLVKYLATFPAGAAVPPEARAAAVKGAVGAVQSPVVSFLQRHNVVSLAPVASLQGDAEHGALFGLLQVFATGNLGAYRAFVAVRGRERETRAWGLAPQFLRRRPTVLTRLRWHSAGLVYF